MRSVHARRYLGSLRTGGSVPMRIVADDGAQYVVKLRGAGQGEHALVAELVVGGLARAVGLPVPELVLVELAPEVVAPERDAELRDLHRASLGLNVGMAWRADARPLERGADPIDPAFASRLVLFDAFVQNADRAARNPNLLVDADGIWLIDHGATLAFLYARGGADPLAPCPLTLDHVLLPWATGLADAEAHLAAHLTPAVIAAAVADVPPTWLAIVGRPDLADVLTRRRAAWSQLAAEAEAARANG